MKLIPARPTTYNGIRMRSRLEADFAATLDNGGYTWAYEPQCFASQRGQYLPDFRLDADPGALYIEIKPRILYGELTVGQINAILDRMEIICESEPGACLGLTFWNTDPAVADTVQINGSRGRPYVVLDHAGYHLPWPRDAE